MTSIDNADATPDADYGQTRASTATGVLVVGHGTRNERGLDEYWQTVKRITDLLPGFQVEGAFLEIAIPDISQGIQRLVDGRCGRVIVAPLLLFAAGHAKRDIPAAVRTAALQHAGTSFSLADPLDCHPKMVELSAQRFHESLGEHVGDSTARLSLVVVGRGSKDDEATASMHQYAQTLANQVNVKNYHVGFLAMAEPRVDAVLNDAVLNNAAATRPTLIVVQPHLLFQGDLLEELGNRVTRFAERHPDIVCRMTGHLGPSRQVAEAVVARLTKFGLSTT